MFCNVRLSSLWCISQCSHDSALNSGYPFHVLQAAPPEQAAAYMWCCHGNHRGPPPTEHGEVRLPQVWLRVGTVLPASRPGGQAWYLSRVPVQWTLRGQHGAGVCVCVCGVCVCVCVWCVCVCVCVCVGRVYGVYGVYMVCFSSIPPHSIHGSSSPDHLPELPEDHSTGESRQGGSWKASSLKGRHTDLRPRGQLQAWGRDSEFNPLPPSHDIEQSGLR